MDESILRHIEEVRAWLDENVQVFTEPQSVTLSDFVVDWNEFSGDFRVFLDSAELPDKLRFGLNASGKTDFYLPMFHSPLGAPASYAAIELTPRTLEAIKQGLHKTIPHVMATGINKETGLEVEAHTPPQLRLSAETLKGAMGKIVNDYSVTVSLEGDH